MKNKNIYMFLFSTCMNSTVQHAYTDVKGMSNIIIIFINK